MKERLIYVARHIGVFICVGVFIGLILGTVGCLGCCDSIAEKDPPATAAKPVVPPIPIPPKLPEEKVHIDTSQITFGDTLESEGEND